ncbi:dihydroxyacetone kinase phosphoryl donor subunit DhaM, partial [Listeria monocytogenes]|uniref:dihydroxyacetone kinase phosphoryl donor subunit DhaM n=2 Tax=Bacillales TaxID=1385 RepID=UPI00112F7BD4
AKQLLEQMVSDVNVLACGGTDDGYIGTSFNSIQNTINHLEDDALCFFDLGSAEMNLDMAIEMYEGSHQVVKVNAPLVEGSFTASVKLSTGGSIEEAIDEVYRTSFSSEN